MTDRCKRIMEHYQCSRESAARYCDLRDEGHGIYQAALMAGLTDPHCSEEHDDSEELRNQPKQLTDELIAHLVDIHVGGPTPSYPLDAHDWINFANAVVAKFCELNGIGPAMKTKP